MRSRTWKIFLGILIVVGLIYLRYSPISQYLTLAHIKNERLILLEFVQNNYVFSVLMYIGIYAISVALFLPFPAILTIAGGYLFGIIPGVLYANIGATTGATISFLIVRYLIGDWFQKRYAKQLAHFNQEMHHSGVGYLLTVHFIAVIPFFILNTLIGLTNVGVWTFIWTTSLGILPGSLVYAFAGRELRSISSIQDIFSLPVILAFIALALLAGIPILVKHVRKKDHGKSD